MIKTDLLHFEQLSIEQLYRVLQLRSDVFVLEQESLYRDMDGQDTVAWHVLAYGDEDTVVGVLRILKDPKDHSCFKIGRVAVTKAARGQGVAVELMERAHDFIAKQEAAERIEISAQEHLQKFYNNLDYVTVSEEPYDDAGIPHVDMIQAV
ncbi:GNAT family N-acetyltransferase [Kiloniella sp. EL199]|uniref:GNAT family N-acetyltransferase n=1 Tax=Kiloniella sp. EL199 TaxID=2107581 RepID=UPI000EA208B4|nr:GNAT family N-acetyltransferase [Kiloniella sp. EL199]